MLHRSLLGQRTGCPCLVDRHRRCWLHARPSSPPPDLSRARLHRCCRPLRLRRDVPRPERTDTGVAGDHGGQSIQSVQSFELADSGGSQQLVRADGHRGSEPEDHQRHPSAAGGSGGEGEEPRGRRLRRVAQRGDLLRVRLRHQHVLGWGKLGPEVLVAAGPGLGSGRRWLHAVPPFGYGVVERHGLSNGRTERACRWHAVRADAPG